MEIKYVHIQFLYALLQKILIYLMIYIHIKNVKILMDIMHIYYFIKKYNNNIYNKTNKNK